MPTAQVRPCDGALLLGFVSIPFSRKVCWDMLGIVGRFVGILETLRLIQDMCSMMFHNVPCEMTMACDGRADNALPQETEEQRNKRIHRMVASMAGNVAKRSNSMCQCVCRVPGRLCHGLFSLSFISTYQHISAQSAQLDIIMASSDTGYHHHVVSLQEQRQSGDWRGQTHGIRCTGWLFGSGAGMGLGIQLINSNPPDIL